MSDSSRPFFRIVWRLVRWALYAAFAGVVLFIAFTRTEAGRNAVRGQIESRFNQQFEGTLEIATLDGSLIRDFVATDVTVRAPSGRLVAMVDSVRAEPHWWSLWSSELSIQHLTLIRPRVHLHRRPDGVWSAEHAFRARRRSENAEGLDLSFSDFTVRQGHLKTTRAGPAPSLVADRWLFDYSRSVAERISLQGSIQWTDRRRKIQVTSVALRLPQQDLALRSARARLTEDDGQWALQSARATLGSSQVHLSGQIRPSPSDSSDTALALTVDSTRINNDEVRRLAPRLPLRSTMTVKGRMSGTLDQFVVNDLAVTHGTSTLQAEGTIYGLPDSLDLDVQVSSRRLAPSDVVAVWSEAPRRRLQATGPVEGRTSVRGTVRWRDGARPHFDLASTFDVASPSGAVRGSLSVQRTASEIRYESSLETDSLNLAATLGRSVLPSQLTGQLSVGGSGTTFGTLSGRGSLDLSSARIQGRRLAGGRLEVEVADRVADGRLTLRQPGGGVLSARAFLDASGSTPFFDLSGTTSDLNLGNWFAPLPSGPFNATISAQGQGNRWRTLTGGVVLQVEPSAFRRDDRLVSVPEHTITLDLFGPSTDEPRLQVGGTIAALQLDGPVLRSSAWQTGRRWWSALRTAAQQEGEKPMADRSTGRLSGSMEAVTSTSVPTPTSSVALAGSLSVRRADLLRLWWPGAPDAADQMASSLDLNMGPDRFRLSGRLSAARLQADSRVVHGLDGTYELTTTSPAAVVDSLRASATIQADSIQARDRALTEATLRFRMERRSGRLDAQTATLGDAGPVRFGTSIELAPSEVRFQVEDLFVGARQDDWQLRAPGTIIAHSDAVRFDSLTVQSPRVQAGGPQRVRFHGTFSPHPSGTLLVDARRVSLFALSELGGLSNAIGGRLDGRIAVTGNWNQPRVRSDFQVHRLSFDRRILGTLRLRSEIAADSPAVLVDASLTPTADSLGGLEGPSLVPKGPRTIEPNRLHVAGRVRLPGLTRQPDDASPDQLDLDVNVDRADLFFFKYIFEEQLATVRGYTSGALHIGGSFDDPVFDAQMQVREGRFTLPQFGLAYGISGPVRVDREGIHLQSVSVTDDDGSATIDGSVLFNDYRFFSFDLAAQLDEISVIDVGAEEAQTLPFYGSIRASGRATLSGPLSDATLRSSDAQTTPDSELYIPSSEGGVNTGTGFIIFADSTGGIPDLRDLTRRDNILSGRPAGEPSFIEGLDIDINVVAPEESQVNLVFDPVVGDVVSAQGTGRIQLQRQEGEFFVYGTFNVTGGTYQFTAGEVFVRRFDIRDGTISWDGNPTNARLDIQAAYQTRASPAGLPGYSNYQGRIPVRVNLDISGRVETPQVDLSLSLVRDERSNRVGSQTLDAILNQPDQTTEYATSVLLTNTFLLTTESLTQSSETGEGQGLSAAGNQLAFNSVSQLVASQLNRYLGAALPNVDLNFGLQGEDPNDLDIIYGVALRLLNERLIIRGEGVYTGDEAARQQAQGPQGEFTVEVRLSSRVSAEVFYRRAGDELTRGQTYTRSTGAGVSYQTEFSTWRRLFGQLFGWLWRDSEDEEPPPADEPDPVAQRPEDQEPSSGNDESGSDDASGTDDGPSPRQDR